MERMALTRLKDLLDKINFLTHNQIAFRPHMSTQDLFLLLQETFLFPTGGQVHALVKVDALKAFDTLLHDRIFAPLHDTSCSFDMYSYIFAFLRSQRAQFRPPC